MRPVPGQGWQPALLLLLLGNQPPSACLLLGSPPATLPARAPKATLDISYSGHLAPVLEVYIILLGADTTTLTFSKICCICIYHSSFSWMVIQELASTALSPNLPKLSLLKLYCKPDDTRIRFHGKREGGLGGNLDAKTQPPKQVKCVHDRLNGQYKPTACV